MNLDELRATRPTQLHAAAGQYDQAAATVERVIDRLDTQVRRPLAGALWQGSANAAALAYIDRIQRTLSAGQDRLASAAGAVERLAEALARARTLAGQAEQLAAAEGLRLDPDGTVHIPPVLPLPSENEQRARLDTAQQVNRLAGQAIIMATEADLACARVLAGTGAAGPDGSGDGADGGGSSLLADLWGTWGWASSGLSVIGAVNQFLPGAVLLPPGANMLTPLGLASSVHGTIDGAMDIIDQGNPVDAYQDRGANYVADYARTGFNASAVAFAVSPNPVTAVAVLGTGAAWAVSANWNHIPFHDNIEDAAEWVGDRGEQAIDWTNDRAQDVIDVGEDVLDTGGDLLEAGGDLVDDITPW